MEGLADEGTSRRGSWKDDLKCVRIFRLVEIYYLSRTRLHVSAADIRAAGGVTINRTANAR